MKIQTLLAVGLLVSGGALQGAERGMVIDVGGQMRIQMGMPIDADVDQTTPITRGRAVVTPVVLVPGLLGQFALDQLSLRFADFDIERRPFGNHSFKTLGVHLSDVSPIVAAESQPGVYTFTLLPDDLTVHGAAFVDGDLETGLQGPAGDVTGVIDLNNQTFSAVVPLLMRKSVLGYGLEAQITITVTGLMAAVSDKDGDGILDPHDNCAAVANPPMHTGLGQIAQPPVASPLVTPPANVSSPTCAVRLVNATAVDLCDGLSTTITSNAPAAFRPGTTTVTWTATSSFGQVGTATQLVSVSDRTPPVFTSVPGPISFPRCHPVSIGVATAGDDCGGREVVIASDAPTQFPLGRTTVTWSATDRSGNRATATQAVTVTSCGLLP